MYREDYIDLSASCATLFILPDHFKWSGVYLACVKSFNKILLIINSYITVTDIIFSGLRV